MMTHSGDTDAVHRELLRSRNEHLSARQIDDLAKQEKDRREAAAWAKTLRPGDRIQRCASGAEWTVTSRTADGARVAVIRSARDENGRNFRRNLYDAELVRAWKAWKVANQGA